MSSKTRRQRHENNRARETAGERADEMLVDLFTLAGFSFDGEKRSVVRKMFVGHLRAHARNTLARAARRHG